MSVHSTEYLHDQVRVGGVKGLIGDDGQVIPGGWRTPAWWFNSELEKTLAQPSHYVGSLPINMIKTQLLGWEAVESAVKLSVELRIPADHPLSKTPGVEEIRQVEFTVPDYKGVVREDKLIECYLNDKLDDLGPEAVMNVTSAGFNTNSFKKVLVDNVAAILQESPADLTITGAGVLKWGRVAYMEVSIPETLHNNKTGMEYRPNLLASSSFDGSVATRYDKTVTNVICDNTHQWALQQSSEKTGSFVVRRTRNMDRIFAFKAREALGIIQREADEFDAILNEWSEIPVSPKQFERWMDLVVPIPTVEDLTKIVSIQGQDVTKVNMNKHTIAMNKRDRLSELYYSDERVSPWAGTKLGIAQLGNTWAHHDQTMKGAKAHGGNVLAARVEGQLLKVMDGTFAKQDQDFLAKIDEVLMNFDAEGVSIPLASDKPVTAQRKRAGKSATQNPATN
jgi:phage/plasmid-like protein (TIGR03299 family)